MTEFIQKAEELSAMLSDSDEYKRFLEAKNELEKDRELYNRVVEYRRRNFYIRNGNTNDKQGELKKLGEENGDILRNTVVREFLNAELILCRIVQEINTLVISKIDFDVSFLE